MPPVSWATLTAAQAEQVLGVLLCREYPLAVRLRPAQGDGGIDVLIPTDDDGVHDVVQIKSFATALTPGRRQQVGRSLERVASNGEVRLREWLLVLPLNPSPHDLRWFADLTVSYPFVCHWRGLDYVENLAAKYPDVIDYYIHDGRERLQRSIVDLRALAGLSPGSDQLVEPSDVTESLGKLYALLNRDDPHYRYEFEVTSTPPDPRHLVAKDGLVASVTQASADVAVTHHVFAKYAMATEDSPIPLTFNVAIADFDEETAKAWERSMRYGTEVALPYGSVRDFHAELPGGLPGEAAVGGARLFPVEGGPDRPYRLRVRALSHENDVLAEALLDMEPVTRGPLGGIRGHGKEEAGAFELELLVDPDQDNATGRVEFTIGLCDLTGLEPAAIRAGIKFLNELRHPNKMQFAPVYGPAAGDGIALETVDPPVTAGFLDFIHALADIQEQLSADVRIPKLDEVTRDTYEWVLRASRLLRGETIRETWSARTLTLSEARPLPTDGPVRLALAGALQFTVGDVEVRVEPLTTVFLAAELKFQQSDEGTKVEVVPALGNDTMLMRRATIDEVAPESLD